MSTEVSESAVEEVTGALDRTFASYASPQWQETAARMVKSGGNLAAAQLAPGETVEWLTPGIVHRHGKIWPEAILLVTPHRLIVAASRGTVRTRREVSSLYRGQESLLGVSYRLLPGTSADHWTLEIATQHGPFLFAVPQFNGSESLAQITGAFITGRARYAPGAGTLLDGAPWGTQVPAQREAPSEDPFSAARADLSPVHGDGPPTQAFTWPETPATSLAEAPLWNPQGGATAAEQDRGASAYPAAGATERSWSDLDPASEPEPAAEAVALAAPDWYADPLGVAGLRYWDGQAWTQHTAD